MNFDIETVYALLPAIYRIRDDEQGMPLKALLSVIAEQIAVLEGDLDQLYDDQFIETCAEWIVPYIGDLIGYRALHGVVPSISSPRAEVAHTIGYRRRKGTAAMLEQLARDVTGWDAHVVEFFQLLATTQYMNHLRPNNLYAPDLRKWEPLERLNTAFDSVAHTLDVRRIENRRGRYNIPNIGIFLWRLGAYSLTESPAFQMREESGTHEPDPLRYLFSPLGNNVQLFSRSHSEDEKPPLSEPADVAMPISRRVLSNYLTRYYGTGESLALYSNYNLASNNNRPVLAELIEVCDLSDLKDASGNIIGWVHMPNDKIAIDPVLGRIAFPSDSSVHEELQPKNVHVTFHYGFSANMGGGEYDRSTSFAFQHDTYRELSDIYPIPAIQDALDELKGVGMVLIKDSGKYIGPSIIQAQGGKRVEVRADNRHRPLLVPADLTQTGEIAISGDDNSEVTLNGLLISGYKLRVSGNLSRFRLHHCTLVPGLALSIDGTTQHPSEASLIVETGGTRIEIDSCILGALQVVKANRQVHITNSIIDATAEDKMAYSGPSKESGPIPSGGSLYIENSTIIGEVSTSLIEMASNTIFLSAVHAARQQEGCVRFSYIPAQSQVPRRYNCQPKTSGEALRVHPQFTSLRYGDPGYCQLSQHCAVEIRQGADDGAEMGAFHNLYQPQRETNLRVRLNEYLRIGLEAGIFYAS